MSRFLTSWIIVFVTLTGLSADKSPTSRRRISVSGTAVTQVPFDVVLWHLVITDFDKDLLAAKRTNDHRVKAILGLRQELGLKEGDLETERVSIHREYEKAEGGGQGAFKHFLITRDVDIRQRELGRFDEFLQKLVASAAPEFSVEFQSSRIQDVRAETRLKALQIAREKAVALAAVVDARLGEVLTVDEHWPTSSFGAGGGGGGFGGYDLGQFLEPDVEASTLVPGPLDVRITVFATFELK
jgi:hypothetical protein